MIKFLGYLIIVAVISALWCFSSRGAFTNKKVPMVIGTYLVIVAMLYASVLLVRWGVLLIMRP